MQFCMSARQKEDQELPREKDRESSSLRDFNLVIHDRPILPHVMFVRDRPTTEMDDFGHYEEALNLLNGEEKGISYHSSEQEIQRKRTYLLPNILAILATFLIGFETGQLWKSRATIPSIHHSRPLYADMDRDSMHTVNFSAFSLRPSPYTAAPGPSVEQAWRDLGVECESRNGPYNLPNLTEYTATDLTFIVPISQGPAFGISSSHVIIPADAPGANGRTGYGVDMEAMHQLHCVNLLRKGLYFNHAHYSAPERINQRPSWPFRDPEKVLRGHLNHCVDALRERIMCAADSEVIPYYWKDTQGS